MFRRILLFAFGALISIFFLSLGPNNRLKDTFYAYIDYFDVNTRVITHLYNQETVFSSQAMCQVKHYNITKEEVLSVLDDGNVNFNLSQENSDPCQFFIIENIFKNKEISVEFKLCYYDNKSVEVLNIIIDEEKIRCND